MYSVLCDVGGVGGGQFCDALNFFFVVFVFSFGFLALLFVFVLFALLGCELCVVYWFHSLDMCTLIITQSTVVYRRPFALSEFSMASFNRRV